MDPYRYVSGNVPVVVSIPHAGTHVPGHILERFGAAAKGLPDTDWHVDKLYDFARALGCHMLIATHSRYVVDLNRAPDNASLYPGKFTTGLCPLTLFDATPVYIRSEEPRKEEIDERIETYWRPYHGKLQSLVDELRKKHGRVAVFDAHSICSQIPTLFEGTLPDLNFGTADGASCSPSLAEKLIAACKQSSYSTVANGRFKGGYITRHYGNPENGVHAIQLELAQKNYMQENPPFAYDEAKAAGLQKVLRGILTVLAKEIS